MRVLIVVARQTSLTSYQLPIGIGYVSGSLKRAGHDVLVLNPNHSQEDLKGLLVRAIREHDPHVLAVGGMAFHLLQIKEVIAIARPLLPHAIILLGGLLVTNQPEVAMSAVPEAHFGVIGDGENASVELLSAISTGSALGSVRGIVFRDPVSGQIKLTDPRPVEENLDSFPWIDFEGLGLDVFAGLHGPGEVAPGLIVDSGARVMPFLTSRGCPFPCTFCCHEAAGRRYRTRSIDDVFAELEATVDRFNINTLCIYDDLFCLKRQRLEEFCQRIRPLNLRWQCSIRVEQVNPDVLKMMRDSGCMVISFGVESMSPTVLESMKKKTTREALEKALAQMYEAKITPWANLIYGDPAETVETANESLEWWRSHNHYDLRTAFVGYHPGSKIYDYAFSSGVIADPVDYLLSNSPEINVTRMPDFEYEGLKRYISMITTIFGFSGRVTKLLQVHHEIYNLEAVCPHCGEENSYTDVRLYAYVWNRLSCRVCNQLYRLPVVFRKHPTSELQQMIDHLNSLIDEDCDAASNVNLEDIRALSWRILEYNYGIYEVWELLVGISIKTGRVEETLAILQQAMVANPYSLDFFEQAGNCLGELGRHAEQEQFYQQAAHLRAIGVDQPISVFY